MDEGAGPPDPQLMAIANGVNIILATLVAEIEARGGLDRMAFANLLKSTAHAARDHDAAIAVGRMDLVMLRNLADLNENHSAWTPVVH